MYRLALLTAAFACLAVGQTKINLQHQAKSVDFTAITTKPLQTGTSLPGTCEVGQMFFLSNAPTGENLYGCVALDTWSLESGSGSGVTIPGVGTQSVLEFTPGTGVVLSLIDTGTSLSIQTSLDTSHLLAQSSAQTGAHLLCNSTSSGNPGVDYACNLLPTLESYSSGMVLHWTPDVDSAVGGALTLNIDTLGAVDIKLADGVTDPAPGDIVAGRLTVLWYDGAQFRLMDQDHVAGVLGETQPTCSAAVQGHFWFVPGTTGVADSLSICAKDNVDAYAWRELY